MAVPREPLGRRPADAVSNVQRCTLCGDSPVAAIVAARHSDPPAACDPVCAGHPVCAVCQTAALRRPGVISVGLGVRWPDGTTT